MDKLNYLIVFITTLSIVNGLKIIDFKVPSAIESDESDGSQKEVILDCEYDGADEAGLTVKWFFNTEEQIYQWIPDQSKPQVLGLLKDRVDLDFKVSNNSKTMYRALKIKDVMSDLSGLYTCQVGTFYSEDSSTKEMIIYERAVQFEIQKDEDTDLVNCTASGLFPKPKMNLFIRGLNITNSQDDNDGEKDESEEDILEENEDSSFNISSMLNFDGHRITEPVTFICELWIPGTDYIEQRTLDYYPGGIPSSIETQIESDYEFPTNATEQDNSSPTQHCSSILMSLVLGIFFQRLF